MNFIKKLTLFCVLTLGSGIFASDIAEFFSEEHKTTKLLSTETIKKDTQISLILKFARKQRKQIFPFQAAAINQQIETVISCRYPHHPNPEIVFDFMLHRYIHVFARSVGTSEFYTIGLK